MSDRPREPLFNIPGVLVAVLAALVGLHAIRLWLPEAVDIDLLSRLAFVPGRVTFALDPDRVAAHLTSLAAGQNPEAVEAGRFFLGEGALQPWTVLTYAALHGNWTHVGLNALWLLAFGAPVARRIGSPRFLLLLAANAVAGALAHWAVDPVSLQPLVGASAAVSGCMGAVLRFLTAPAGQAPLPPLGTVLRNRRVLSFVAIWLLSNFLSGIAAIPLGLSDMPIAWQAHVGGFAFGLLAFPLFDRSRSRTTPDAASVPHA